MTCEHTKKIKTEIKNFTEKFSNQESLIYKKLDSIVKAEDIEAKIEVIEEARLFSPEKHKAVANYESRDFYYISMEALEDLCQRIYVLLDECDCYEKVKNDNEKIKKENSEKVKKIEESESKKTKEIQELKSEKDKEIKELNELAYKLSTANATNKVQSEQIESLKIELKDKNNSINELSKSKSNSISQLSKSKSELDKENHGNKIKLENSEEKMKELAEAKKEKVKKFEELEKSLIGQGEKIMNQEKKLEKYEGEITSLRKKLAKSVNSKLSGLIQKYEADEEQVGKLSQAYEQLIRVRGISEREEIDKLKGKVKEAEKELKKGIEAKKLQKISKKCEKLAELNVKLEEQYETKIVQNPLPSRQ
jgi:hypothetical protein